jgi:hypothetical protein
MRVANGIPLESPLPYRRHHKLRRNVEGTDRTDAMQKRLRVDVKVNGRSYASHVATEAYGVARVRDATNGALKMPAELQRARCLFSNRNLHSMMPLVPTPARLKLLQACDQYHSSRAVHYRLLFALSMASQHKRPLLA